MWDPSKHKKSENEAYISGRASEWVHFPIVLTQILVPISFWFVKWYYVLIALVVLDIAWGFVRDKYISVRLADTIWQINKVKWIIFIVFGGTYIAKDMYVEAALSFLWPFVSLLLAFINPKQNFDAIKKKFESAFAK